MFRAIFYFIFLFALKTKNSIRINKILDVGISGQTRAVDTTTLLCRSIHIRPDVIQYKTLNISLVCHGSVVCLWKEYVFW